MKSPEEIQFNDLMKDDFLCAKLVEDICKSRSFQLQGQRIYEGSRILYEIAGGKIVKIFSRDELSFCQNEADYLKKLHGRLSITTPRLISSGIQNGYPFLIMQKLDGSPLSSVWNKLSIWGKKQALAQIAQLLRELHSLPFKNADTEISLWNSFIRTQTDDLLHNHREFGLSSQWTEKIAEFIQNTETIEFSSDPVICHTEIMQEHLFMAKEKRGFNITGLIDFEPSMIAIPEYDFCSVGLFISAGNKGLFNHFLESYGYQGDSTDIMRMLLLHRYSNLKWFMSTIPDNIGINSIEDLMHYWF